MAGGRSVREIPTVDEFVIFFSQKEIFQMPLFLPGYNSFRPRKVFLSDTLSLLKNYLCAYHATGTVITSFVRYYYLYFGIKMQIISTLVILIFSNIFLAIVRQIQHYIFRKLFNGARKINRIRT